MIVKSKYKKINSIRRQTIVILFYKHSALAFRLEFAYDQYRVLPIFKFNDSMIFFFTFSPTKAYVRTEINIIVKDFFLK